MNVLKTYSRIWTYLMLLVLSAALIPAVWAVPGDISGDGVVDIEDLNIMMLWWLSSPCEIFDHCGGADIAGPPERSDEGGEGGPDGRVDFYDFAVLAAHWLEQGV